MSAQPPNPNAPWNAQLPWAQWPIAPQPGLPMPGDYNTPWPELDDPPQKLRPAFIEDPTEVGSIVYVMRSKKYGSSDPDDQTAPLGLDVANPDTYESWNPPLKTVTTIIDIDDGTPGVATIETAVAHGIPAVGGPFQVILDNTNSTPVCDGIRLATRVDNTHFTIPFNLSVTGNLGDFQLPYNACEATDGPREYEIDTEGLFVFYEGSGATGDPHGFFNWIYDRFTRKRTDYGGGRFKIHGEEAATRLSSITMNAT